jgi:hypothetical protein
MATRLENPIVTGHRQTMKKPKMHENPTVCGMRFGQVARFEMIIGQVAHIELMTGQNARIE